MKELIARLEKLGVLQTPALIEAFSRADRKNFVPPAMAADAYQDTPLPIGAGQTISQPYTVAFMLELLAAQPGQRVLDIGFGSGWTTALLAGVVGEAGRVFGLEVVPQLYEFGRQNLARTGYRNVELFLRSGAEGLAEHAPFDRIIAGAAASEIPRSLLEQLADGGRLVIPVGEPQSCAIAVVDKRGGKGFRRKDHPGFAFVPFIK